LGESFRKRVKEGRPIRVSIPVSEFIDLTTSFGFVPTISIPTQFCRSSAALIDNLFLKIEMLNRNDIAGVMMNQISDHQAYFLMHQIHPLNKKCEPLITVVKRSRNFLDDVKNELRSNDLMTILSEHNDLNENCTLFIDTLKAAVGKFTSTKTCRPNKYKLKMSSWITFGIIYLFILFIKNFL
jgi:hypothetical protein